MQTWKTVRSEWEEKMAEKEVEDAWGDGQVVAEELKEKAKAGVKWVYCKDPRPK